MSETINKLNSFKEKETQKALLKKKKKRSKKLALNNSSMEFDLNKIKNKLSKILEDEDKNKIEIDSNGINIKNNFIKEISLIKNTGIFLTTNIVNFILKICEEKERIPDVYKNLELLKLLLNVTKTFFFNDFELLNFSIYLDKLAWDNKSLNPVDFLFVLGFAVKIKLIDHSIQEVFIQNSKLEIPEFYNKYMQWLKDCQFFSHIRITEKDLNSKFKSLSKKVDYSSKTDLIDYNYIVEKILKMTLPHSENKLKINKFTTNHHQIQDHGNNKNNYKENYFKLIKIPTFNKTQTSNENKKEYHCNKSSFLNAKNNILPLTNRTEKHKNESDSLPVACSNEIYKNLDTGNNIGNNSNLIINLREFKNKYVKSNSINGYVNYNCLIKQENTEVSQQKFTIVPITQTESGKNNYNNIANNLNFDNQNIIDSKNNCDRKFNSIENQTSQQIIGRNNIMPISSLDFFQDDIQHNALRKINKPKEQKLNIPTNINSQLKFSQISYNNWNRNNSVELKSNCSESLYNNRNLMSANFYKTANAYNNEFYQCNGPYLANNTKDILETKYFPKILSENFSQRNEDGNDNIDQIDSKKIGNYHYSIQSINHTEKNNNIKKNKYFEEC